MISKRDRRRRTVKKAAARPIRQALLVDNRRHLPCVIRAVPVIIVTHIGKKDRVSPVGSQGRAPTHPAWVHNLRVNPDVEIRDLCGCAKSKTRSRLWKLAIAAYP